MAEEQRAVAETRAQRRAEFREHLDAAAALLTRHDLAAASARVAEALRLKPGDPEARAVQGQIARQMDDARVAAMAAGRPGASPARAGRRGSSAGPPVAGPPHRDGPAMYAPSPIRAARPKEARGDTEGSGERRKRFAGVLRRASGEHREQRLLRVQPVLGLIEDDRRVRIDDLVGDFVAAMGRQAVHEDRAGGAV